MTGSEHIILVFAPMVLVGVFVIPFLRVGLDLGDEGYLVYGTARLRHGALPIRDFRAYDPGRYYWCALFSLIFGQGFIAIRLAMAVVMVFTLVLINLLMVQATNSVILGGITCALALIWLQPRHKQIENFFTILCVYLLYQIHLDGTWPQFFILGAAIGLAAFFGLNIAIYFCGSSVLACLVVGLPSLSELGMVILGGLFGLLPIAVMVFGCNGYARAYYDRKVAPLFQRGSTNLKLPHPWIWVGGKTGFTGHGAKRAWVLQALFSLIPLIFTLALLGQRTLADTTGGIALIGIAACVGLVNFLHTLSRSDLGHMFQPALPLALVLALGAFLTLGEWGAIALVALAICGSAWLVWQHPYHPPRYLGLRRHMARLGIGSLVLPQGQVDQISELAQIVATHTDANDTILSVPLQIGYCALFQRKHATYDSFPVYPSTAKARESMLAELCHCAPKIALIGNNAVDKRDELIFLRNYPNVADHLAQNYMMLKTIGNIQVFVKTELDPLG